MRQCKRLLATTLVLSLLLPAANVIAAFNPICGDVNDSGAVSSSDALLVLKTAVGQATTLACPSCPSVQKYGISSELPQSSSHSPNYLLGSQIKILNASTLTHLALISKLGGFHVQMALYTDDGGNPGELVVGTSLVTLLTGVQEIPVPITPIAAGYYWIMAVFEASSSIARDTSDPTAIVRFRDLPFGDPLPLVFGEAAAETGEQYSYYVKVIE